MNKIKRSSKTNGEKLKMLKSHNSDVKIFWIAHSNVYVFDV